MRDSHKQGIAILMNSHTRKKNHMYVRMKIAINASHVNWIVLDTYNVFTLVKKIFNVLNVGLTAHEKAILHLTCVPIPVKNHMSVNVAKNIHVQMHSRLINVSALSAWHS